MSTVVNPIDNPELYNSIRLGGVISPGVVKLSGHDRKVDWDVKTGPQLEGATTTRKATPPIDFTASFYLVRDDAIGVDDFADWPAFQDVIESTTSGKTPKAIDIYHPDLASQHPPITSVVKAKVAGTLHDGKGGQTIVVQFQEYRPPKAKGGTPVGAKTKKSPDPNDPDAAAKAQIAALTQQYKDTPWG